VQADPDRLSSKVLHHPAAAAARIFQMQSVDPGHGPQSRLPRRSEPVAQRGARQSQQRTLSADAELRVVVIDQLAQVTGIRSAEICMASPAPSAAPPIC
jgi:hypothetical protein